jgi:uncharacterized integral membrane protein
LSIISVYFLQQGGITVSVRPILLFILILLVVVFVVQNSSVTEIKFLFWNGQLSKAIIIFISLFVGFVIGFWPRWRKVRPLKRTEAVVEEKGEEK